MIFYFLPAIITLGSISLLPILNENFWHKFYKKYMLIIAGLSTLICWQIGLGISHTLIYEFIPFITTIATLYLVCGHLKLETNLVKTSLGQGIYFCIGALVANLVGTTGATILLIKPLLKYVSDYMVYVFFILIVSNVGGFLTPIGDPPLLLGFLKGISAEWMLRHHFLIWLTMVSFLLFVFLLQAKWRKSEENCMKMPSKLYFRIAGIHHAFILTFLLLWLIFGKLYINDEIWHCAFHVIFMVLFCSLSVFIDKTMIQQPQIWRANLEPIIELSIIFFAIFISIIPLLHILPNLIKSEDISLAVNFFGCGLFSSVLDNAPTYLIFLTLNNMDVNLMMQNAPAKLVALAAGSVFMGGLTYIGNAPNLLVRSIAQNHSIKMPNFFHYTALAVIISMPGFLIIYWLLSLI